MFRYFSSNKLFFLFFLHMIFIISIPVFCQKKINLGIKGGISQSNINLQNNFFPTIIKTSKLNSYNFSIVSEFINEKNVGIRIELNMIQKGYFQNLYSVGSNPMEVKLFSKLDYINFPFLLQYYFLEKKQNIYINLGPYFEYLIKLNNQEIPSDINSSDVYFFNKNRDKKLGYGLKMSLGYSNLIKNNSIQFSISYMYNFSNILNSNLKSESTPDVSNLNSLSLSVFYLFQIN